MSSVEKFRHDLGRELVGAAHRQAAQQEAGDRAPQRVPGTRRLLPILGLALVLVVVAISVFAIPGPLDSPDATADSFAILELEDRVELQVIDIISDPAAVQRQLEDELGLQAEVMAVPAEPQRVGRVGAVGTTGDIAPEMVRDSDGKVTKVVLPSGFNGSVWIEYGRAAEPGEMYMFTTTSPLCADYFGQDFATIGAEVDRLATHMRYETMHDDFVMTPEVPIDDIPDDYLFVDIIALSDDSYLVTYAANTTMLPPEPNCE